MLYHKHWTHQEKMALGIQLVCWDIVEADHRNTQGVAVQNLLLLAVVVGHTTAVGEKRHLKNVNSISN